MRRWFAALPCSGIVVGCLALASVLCPTIAGAQLRLSIRSESALSVTAYRDGSDTKIDARLVDDLGAPVAGATLEVFADAEPSGCFSPRASTTDADGRASVTIAAGCSLRSVRVAYPGDRLREPIGRATQVAPLPPSGHLVVSLIGGTTVDLDAPAHVLAVAAPEGANAAGLHVVVTDELERPIADGTLGADGSTKIALSSDRLGAPGAGRIGVTLAIGIAGTDRRADVWVLRHRRTSLELDRLPDDDATIAVRGRLFDAVRGLPGETVAIEVDGHPLGAIETADDGRFRFRFRGALRYESVSPRVIARYVSSNPGRSDAVSRAIRVPKASALPRRTLFALLPLLVAILVLALAWQRSRRPRPQPEDDRASTVRIARPRLRARATRREIAVHVTARRDGSRLANALVRLERDAQILVEEIADAAGAARLGPLADGSFRVRVVADGYQPVEFPASIPHRGELDDVAVRLVSLRERALDVFEPIAAEVLGARDGIGTATIREVARRGASLGLPDDVPDEAERLAYAAPAPSTDELENLDGRVKGFLGRRRSP